MCNCTAGILTELKYFPASGVKFCSEVLNDGLHATPSKVPVTFCPCTYAILPFSKFAATASASLVNVPVTPNNETPCLMFPAVKFSPVDNWLRLIEALPAL